MVPLYSTSAGVPCVEERETYTLLSLWRTRLITFLWQTLLRAYKLWPFRILISVKLESFHIHFTSQKSKAFQAAPGHRSFYHSNRPSGFLHLSFFLASEFLPHGEEMSERCKEEHTCFLLSLNSPKSFTVPESNWKLLGDGGGGTTVKGGERVWA